MTQDDLDLLLHAAGKLAQLMVTVAPESVSLEQISDLSAAGVIVSIGHSNAGYQLICDAAGAGARCFTHLYNAMSPLTNREPGVVGAALMSGDLHAGLIADGFHVHPAAIRIALDAKRGRGRIFLVSDAMSVAGTDIGSFKLGERTIFRRDGRLTLSDGTLAGADLDMGKAVRYLVETVGVDLGEALKMASQYPAQCVGAPETYGHLKPGAVADFVHLDDALQVRGVWKRGTPVD